MASLVSWASPYYTLSSPGRPLGGSALAERSGARPVETPVRQTTDGRRASRCDQHRLAHVRWTVGKTARRVPCGMVIGWGMGDERGHKVGSLVRLASWTGEA